ncbi:MAG TPA: M48 family metallopeptidase, partial [Candidatus Udaeobacter sp.]|nr:M48 family metallopeptidase [Candidatus Udaeobacter sp.]
DTDPAARARVLAYFTPEDIARGSEYSRAYLPGSAVRSLLTWSWFGWLMLAGGGRRLADWALKLTRGRGILSAMLVALVVTFGLRLITLPVTFYHGFVLEGRFGFRRLAFWGWVARLLKGWGVALVLEAGAAGLFFGALTRFPRHWLRAAVIGGAILSFVIAVVWQPLILPIFYKVSPLPPGPLRDGVTELAAKAGVPVHEIRLIDQSRVSAHTNAFFSGIGSRREIYLYDTLSEQHDVPEVLAVVAHEIGHWRRQHVLKGWVLGVAGSAIGLWFLSRLLASRRFLAAAHAYAPTDPALVPVLWVLVLASGLAVSPIENAVSRHFEREADQASIALIPDPEIFVTMKVESARSNRAALLPHPFLVFWNST